MAGEKVSVDKQDVRLNYPNFTGNFIIAGTPEHKKLGNSWVINFSINWSNYKGKDKFSDPFYVEAECFVSTQEELDKALQSIKRKGRIHVTKGIPRVDSWEKDGKKFSKFRVNVREWYPYHLDKDLNEKISTENESTESTSASQSTSTSSSDLL